MRRALCFSFLSLALLLPWGTDALSSPAARPASASVPVMTAANEPSTAVPGEPARPAHGPFGAVSDEPTAAAQETSGAAPGAHEPAEAQGGAEGSGSPALELPDFLHTLKVYFGGPEDAERPTNLVDTLFAWRGPFFALITLLLLSTLLLRGAAKREMIPGRFQNGIEYVVESFYNFIEGILGHEARRYVPFLGTLFLYIWIMNLSGLVPLWKAPTSMFETTLGLAIVVFFYVHSIGLRRLGIRKYLYHLIGSPTDAIGWALVPLMLPLHIVGEIARPVSLSLRLFGNIMGEDVLIAVFTWLGVASLSMIHSPIGIPLEFPFIFLGLLLSTIQALVFTLLSTIYISQMLPHAEEHES